MIEKRSVPALLSLVAPASRPPDGLFCEFFFGGTVKRGGLLTFILALLFSIISSVHVPVAQAATTFTVNSLLDNTTTDGNCTLREAILAADGTPANADCGADSGGPYNVNFSISGTITLGSTLPNISRDQTIDGAGQNVSISGNNAVRLFSVNAATTLTLTNLTLTQGFSLSGTGGIYNQGTLDITGCTFSNNSATGMGGAIYSTGTAVNITISNSTFSGNTASSGGAIRLDGGTLDITGSTFSRNHVAPYFGGALDLDGGNVTIDKTSFLDNTGGATAGAIDHDYGTLTITNSTFSGNQSNEGGAIWEGNALILANSTFSGNSSTTNGGAIAFFGNSATIFNGTFAGNSATVGGAIYTSTGKTVTLTNTIVVDSPSGGNCGGPGTITDGGNNLQFGGTVANSCGATIPTPVSDPLGSNVLANNGGPTETIALPEGSAAIDAGNDGVCAAAPVNGVDQRGVTRPQGLHCDIGAYEYVPTAAPIPTLTEWGMITFMLLAGLGAIYYMRRQRKAES